MKYAVLYNPDAPNPGTVIIAPIDKTLKNTDTEGHALVQVVDDENKAYLFAGVILGVNSAKGYNTSLVNLEYYKNADFLTPKSLL